MTTLSAERLAELEAELARWKLQSDDWQKAAYANDARATAAESALAAARATLRDVQALLLAIDNMSWKNNIGLPAEFGTVNAKVAITLAALTETGHD